MSLESRAFQCDALTEDPLSRLVPAHLTDKETQSLRIRSVITAGWILSSPNFHSRVLYTIIFLCLDFLTRDPWQKWWKRIVFPRGERQVVNKIMHIELLV